MSMPMSIDFANFLVFIFLIEYSLPTFVLIQPLLISVNLLPAWL